MKSKILTAVPVCNGEEFIEQTLASVARQTLRPDRVVVLDNCSTDHTEEIVRSFKGIGCEFIRNPTNLGLFGNFNRSLEFADQTEYLQILHADDLIEPQFYEAMTGPLADCDGLGLAWCLDERIDEQNRHLSFSGRVDGKIEVLDRDAFLKRKAEIGNQAFCATLMKTARRPVPCQFPLDFPIIGDVVFWAEFGALCRKTVHVHRALGKYRWHSSTQTVLLGPSLQSLVYDEWRIMERIEALRGKGWSLDRKLKLKGLLAVRSGVKAKRVRQNGNPAYSREIVQAARGLTSWPLWVAGQILVELRDFYLFTILRRTRHPKNIYG
jgi:glycosyltransferase involved in cell wall biosynthesis